MTGLCLCDKKVSIMKYPTKYKKQETIDIMVNIFFNFVIIAASIVIYVIFCLFS